MRKSAISFTALLLISACSTTSDNPQATKTVLAAPAIAEMTLGERRNAEFRDRLSGRKLLKSLKEGGFVIYFRHAKTERDYADQADPNLDLQDCQSQRKLSLQGLKQAHTIGVAFAEKEIPVDEIITSDYCRAWKTANLAFGRYDRKDSRLNFLPYEEYTESQVAEMKAAVTPLLIKVPANGSNTVIVGHDDLFESATGIYPDPQGIAYVLKPDGRGSFELVANLLPGEWSQL